MGYIRRSKSVSGPEVDQHEFDSLPPALQRKYFSSLERLRLAHDDFVPTSTSQCNDNPKPKCPLNNAHRIDHGSIYSERPSSRRLRRSKSSSTRFFAVQTDREWFSTLPLKIQQTHFSREEQVVLAVAGDTVLLDAADERLLRLSHQTSAMAVEALPLEPEQDIGAGVFGSFCWGEEKDNLDLSLDEYHAAIADTFNSDRPPGRDKPSYRRNLSVASIQFQRNPPSFRKQSQSSQSGSTRSPLPAYPRPVSNLLGPRHKSHASLSSIDPAAKHYRDPEARLKLRVYLASPQKFDEALEFGFPSIDKKEHSPHARPATSAGLTKKGERTFFRDDTDFPYNDESRVEDEDSSVTDSDSPRTPQEPVFQSFRSSEQSNSDRSGRRRHTVARKLSEPYPHASPANREMTLHMTLTRSDLRTTNNLRSPVVTIAEPVPAAELPHAPEQQSIWDTLPTEESRMKRFWKRLRKS